MYTIMDTGIHSVTFHCGLAVTYISPTWKQNPVKYKLP